MTKSKIFICSLIIMIVGLFAANTYANSYERVGSGISNTINNIDPTSNFFTKKTDTTVIDITDQREDLVGKGYEQMAENSDLILYCKRSTMGIAVYHKANGYTWYSNYNQIDNLNPPLTSAVTSRIESGVTIEYYDANLSSITSAELTYTSSKANLESVYTKLTNGFKVDLDFKAVGIKFSVVVTIQGDQLLVNVPYQSIEEATVGKLQPKDYQLKSITLFPYFGSQNYNINGYAFIPDGSGALIRYNSEVSSTAFIKKIYGPDFGLQTATTRNQHLKTNNIVGLPIYGINHGYNQAAFLAEIVSGSGASEIHSYPYMYNNLPLNTTFFRFITRDMFILTLSNGSTMNLITDTPYPSDYSLKYTFLAANDANYVGMANSYRESLGLTRLNESNDIPLRMELLGVDYKPGLFGKKFITMTSFTDALQIIQELEAEAVKNFQITYTGFNQGGYFNNGAVNAKVSNKLGSKSDLTTFQNYLEEHGYNIDYRINPMISDQYGFMNDTVKKINLSAFEISLKSSLNQRGYYRNVNKLSNLIIKNSSIYQKLNIDSFYMDRLSDAFSYRYQNQVIYREEMIDGLQAQLELLNQYRISTSTPNSYLYRFLTNYYDMYYESSKFIYVTDSIPFISILLSGYANLFMTNINYLSDYDLANLRMIEYNLYPSFIITKNETYKLRYTNFEYVNSTEFRLWKDLMVDSYQFVNQALKHVRGLRIISHQYLEEGISEIIYEQGIVIVINYSDKKINCQYGEIEPHQYVVIKGYEI